MSDEDIARELILDALNIFVFRTSAEKLWQEQAEQFIGESDDSCS